MNRVSTRLISWRSQLLRQLSTAAATPAKFRNSGNRKLYRRLLAVNTSGEKLAEVLDPLMNSRNKAGLFGCVKHLHKFGRYQHCLEILEWMESGGIEYSERDYGLHLNTIYKVKGIVEAEKYFNGLRSDAKNQYTCGTLLNAYCVEKMADKALALFHKMDQLDYVSNVLPFNSLLSLYVKADHPEKVPPLVQEMKRRNISLNSFSYEFWLQSYGCLNDIEGVGRVIAEVQEQNLIKDVWRIYRTLTSIYMKAGLCEKAYQALEKLMEVLDHHPDWVGYHYLIGAYADIGKLESVYQAWGKLNSKFKDCNNMSFYILLQALSKLDDIVGSTKWLRMWEMRYKSYDDRIPTVVIGAYLRHDMLEEAELLLKKATCKAGERIRFAHVVFMDYFLRKRQIDSAVRHLKAAIANKWKPYDEKLDPFFKHFIEEKDVGGLEEFCQIIGKVQRLDGRA